MISVSCFDRFHFTRANSIADLETIRSIAQIIWPETFESILTRDQISYMMEMMYAPNVLTKELHDGHVFYILCDGEIPIGYIQISAYPPKGTAKLHKVYLLSNYHHQGLGQLMLNYAVECAKELGFQRIILNVNKNNSRAISAYKRNGFRQIDSVVNDIGSGFVMDDYIFARTL